MRTFWECEVCKRNYEKFDDAERCEKNCYARRDLQAKLDAEAKQRQHDDLCRLATEDDPLLLLCAFNCEETARIVCHEIIDTYKADHPNMIFHWNYTPPMIDDMIKAAKQIKLCDLCESRGHGFRERGLSERVHYRKCMELSEPCDNVGNVCGLWKRHYGQTV